MNRFGFNRSTLNGVVYALVLASASISCSAAVNAVAIRDAEALAPAFGAAYVNANATVTRYVSASFEGIGNLYPQVTHIHASQASLEGNVDLVAYVLRSVQAQAMAQGNAEIIAVVASTMGGAGIDSSAEVAATATRIQKAHAGADAYALVTLSVAPTVCRMVSATAVAGMASVRAETSIWQISHPYTLSNAYAMIGAGAELATAERVLRMVRASMDCSALASGVGTLKQPARATLLASATLLNANPNIVAIPFVQLGCSGNLAAQALRIALPGAMLDAAAGVSASALQKHVAGALVDANAELIATPLATRHAEETLQGNAAVTASALRLLLPVTTIDGAASLNADALRVAQAGATLDASAVLTANAVRGLLAQASLSASAELQANALRHLMLVAVVPGSASVTAQVTYDFRALSGIDAQADLAADALRSIPAAAAFQGSAEIFADTVCNPASYDPDDRTFYSPARVTEFMRPFVETEFRRAA